MISLWKVKFDEKEKKAVMRVLDSGIVTRGPEILALEKAFANKMKKKYAIAVSSGTAGLHILTKILGWQEGDEVITTPLSFISTGNVLLYEKVKPIFIDIDEKTLCMDPNLLESNITKNTKGLLNVHLYGLPAYSKIYQEIAKKNNLKILEDASQAHGIPNTVFPVGKNSDATVYSLCFNKIITAGEGGIITTDSEKIYNACVSLRDQGRVSNPNWLEETTLGFNYRLSELNSALALAQLDNLETLLYTRKNLASLYSELLMHESRITLPSVISGLERSWFSYFILLENEKIRQKVQTYLKANNIESKTSLPLLYKFPQFKDNQSIVTHCPIAESVSTRLLQIPLHPFLSEQDIIKVSSHILKALDK